VATFFDSLLEKQRKQSHISGMTASFSLTESAATQINHLKSKEGKPELCFRISVKGGGCSGFQYEFMLDDNTPASSDIVVEKNGAAVIIDEISLGLLGGAVLDYTEDLSQAGFEIKNPSATSSCGCGNSFSVAL
jgi:iron-sulfur cluster insertion protein